MDYSAAQRKRISLRALILFRRKERAAMPESKTQRLRLVSVNASPRTLARVDLSRPGAFESLREIATDFLFEHCSDEGKRKLLEQHQLLAA